MATKPKASIMDNEIDDRPIEDDDAIEERAHYKTLSIFQGKKLATAPAVGVVVPSTPDGKKARYMSMIDQQITYLEGEQKGESPTTFNKVGKAVKARTWYQRTGDKVFCKIRWGKGFMTFGGMNSVVVESVDEAIDFYQGLKHAVDTGEFQQEMGVSF